jgi:hypothetical protein
MAPQLAALLQLQGRHPDAELGAFLALTLVLARTGELPDTLARQAAAALAAGGGAARAGPFWCASYVRLHSAPVGGEG